jgi:sensor histidine kinase regulating citrate/malate metabolism
VASFINEEEMDNIIAIVVVLVFSVVGLVGTYAVSLYFGRQTNTMIGETGKMIAETGKMIAETDKLIADGQRRSEDGFKFTQALMADGQRRTEALLERLGSR